jgi:chromosome segregation ATPase
LNLTLYAPAGARPVEAVVPRELSTCGTIDLYEELTLAREQRDAMEKMRDGALGLVAELQRELDESRRAGVVLAAQVRGAELTERKLRERIANVEKNYNGLLDNYDKLYVEMRELKNERLLVGMNPELKEARADLASAVDALDDVRREAEVAVREVQEAVA